jgi:hypothetical protein
VALSDDLERIAAVAQGFADEGEQLAGVLVADPSPGRRVYLCAYAVGSREEERRWLVLDAAGTPLERRIDVRDAVSIVATCEIAVEAAGGGQLEELRSQLAALRVRENPPGIDEAEDAALELERTIGTEPRVASPAYLDRVGAATLRLEQALGPNGGSPFAVALKQAMAAVQALAADVERAYKRPLE